MRVFFYGLFMDEDLLAAKGIVPSEVDLGFVKDYALQIGERATLIPLADHRAYGAVMDIPPEAATDWYAEESVADYVSEPVTVELLDGRRIEAACYNLPSDKVTGANKAYAASLLKVATRLKFPASYLENIHRAASLD